MKNWEEDDTAGYCAAAEDLQDARAVCQRLGIPLHTINFSAEYWDRVFEYFLAEYRAGRTPNPDVLCNKEIKFRAFLDYALDRGADLIATGHYARIDRNRRARLLRGTDAGKDQSYFLHTLGQDQLHRALFPVGELQKSDVRTLAREAGFANHGKKDSTGICFIGERNFRQFLRRYLPARAGEVRTSDGHTVGRHEGLMYYTLGQRQGLGIGGRPGRDGEPWYVVEKDLERNVLVVAQGRDNPLLYRHTLEALELHWVAGTAPALPLRCRAKTRYRQPDQPCIVADAGAGRCRVEFDDPQWAPTPGQSVVFYAGDECLGGGVITA
ncbi:MAG: tRNA 2-thiouridine(34) synthase MnmA [Gammaproteobacteria bacterium]|nr:tRNA 2-thiouridine(34) synthase MnmA [Gammaproteobacteria bacterium]NIR32842.1 tRNA 2-thiouridine(34) synthase MnmA [Gammaproteobacteria bacterium]NIR99389.1 tRNA 2-thiouridine(34) synthase MnmA [Gammaproteobacteria bacterium]NIT65003.1 tRNA 2-thiouridine(34) synthase MnmA [Gammaproteobacteria bacterium]NIV21917.1 tRNA 2-thiouridine(34) synthase MnmA [Gammaproteobacteria bacterium]